MVVASVVTADAFGGRSAACHTGRFIAWRTTVPRRALTLFGRYVREKSGVDRRVGASSRASKPIATGCPLANVASSSRRQSHPIPGAVRRMRPDGIIPTRMASCYEGIRETKSLQLSRRRLGIYSHETSAFSECISGREIDG